MPNYNQSGGISRQERGRLQSAGSADKNTVKNLTILGIGIVLILVFVFIKFGTNFGEGDGAVTLLSYAPWMIAAIGLVFLGIGANGMNGQNADVVAKRQQKAEAKARRKAEKAAKKGQ